jgi:hypothetical protein
MNSFPKDKVFIKIIDYLDDIQFKQQVAHYDKYFRTTSKQIKIPKLLKVDFKNKKLYFEYIDCNLSLLDLFKKYINGDIEFSDIEIFFSKIAMIMELNLDNGVLHGDLVLHNIYINDDIVLIDCFPPCDLPERLRFFTWSDEYCGFLFNIFSNIEVRNFSKYKKILPIIDTLSQVKLIRNCKLLDLCKGCGNSGLDYYRIKSKYHPKIKIFIKTTLLVLVTFGALTYEKYFRN